MRWFHSLFGYSQRSIHLENRRSLYRGLNTIKLPERDKSDLQAIMPKLYYIIWEKYLTKPKIFRYSFISEYFAHAFADKRLQGYRYNILPGKELLNFGITHAKTKLKNVDLDGSKDSLIKYAFPDNLSAQNKKTMRTLYRRNLRRLLNQKKK